MQFYCCKQRKVTQIHLGRNGDLSLGALGRATCWIQALNDVFVVVQLLSHVQLFVIPWTAARQASFSLTISQSLLNSCPSSQWCHPTMSSSVIPFSSCLQSFPAGSFPVSQFFESGGQSIGASASASVLPVNIQGWFPWGLTGWISLQSKGLSSLLQHHSSKGSVLQFCLLYGPALTSVHDYRKNDNPNYMDLCQQSDASAF